MSTGYFDGLIAVHPNKIIEQRAKGWVDFHPETYCHLCGQRNVKAWSVDSALWNETFADPSVIACPQCFTEMYAQKQGTTIWRLSPLQRDVFTINTNGLTAHPARCAASYPVVQGLCPACRCRSLFLASGGYVTCANLSCANPTAVADQLLAPLPTFASHANDDLYAGDDEDNNEFDRRSVSQSELPRF